LKTESRVEDICGADDRLLKKTNDVSDIERVHPSIFGVRKVVDCTDRFSSQGMSSSRDKQKIIVALHRSGR
jgi:hypothetical protein